MQGAVPTPASFSPETNASIARSGDSYRDNRIKAVFAIAPALGEAFDESSFAEVKIPVSLTAGTADMIAPVATNIHRIAGLMPEATISMVPGAAHNTFLDTCLPDAVDQVASLCKDGPGVDRDAIHAQTVARALTFFSDTLPSKPQ
jgi:predicted dienelactone hydrolase